MSRSQGKYVTVDPSNPQAAGVCDRCGFQFPLRELTWQMEWAGTHLYRTGALVCTTINCLDVPQPQLRTILLPPDPPPMVNSRVPNFAYEEQTSRITQFAGPFEPPQGAGPQMLRCTQSGEQVRILQYLTSS